MGCGRHSEGVIKVMVTPSIALRFCLDAQILHMVLDPTIGRPKSHIHKSVIKFTCEPHNQVTCKEGVEFIFVLHGLC